MSIFVLDEGQSSGVIATDPHTKVVRIGVTFTIRKYVLGAYRRIEFRRKQFAIELECEPIRNVRRHVLATGDASGSQQNYGKIDERTRGRLNDRYR